MQGFENISSGALIDLIVRGFCQFSILVDT